MPRNKSWTLKNRSWTANKRAKFPFHFIRDLEDEGSKEEEEGAKGEGNSPKWYFLLRASRVRLAT